MKNEMITTLSFLIALALNLLFKIILRQKDIKISYVLELGEGYFTFLQEIEKENNKRKKTIYKFLNYVFIVSIIVFILSILI